MKEIKEKIPRFIFIVGGGRAFIRIILIPWAIMAFTLGILGFIDQGLSGLYFGLLASFLYGLTLFFTATPILGIVMQLFAMKVLSEWLYKIIRIEQTSLIIWFFWTYIAMGVVINIVVIVITIKHYLVKDNNSYCCGE